MTERLLTFCMREYTIPDNSVRILGKVVRKHRYIEENMNVLLFGLELLLDVYKYPCRVNIDT